MLNHTGKEGLQHPAEQASAAEVKWQDVHMLYKGHACEMHCHGNP